MMTAAHYEHLCALRDGMRQRRLLDKRFCHASIQLIAQVDLGVYRLDLDSHILSEV